MPDGLNGHPDNARRTEGTARHMNPREGCLRVVNILRTLFNPVFLYHDEKAQWETI